MLDERCKAACGEYIPLASRVIHGRLTKWCLSYSVVCEWESMCTYGIMGVCVCIRYYDNSLYIPGSINME